MLTIKKNQKKIAIIILIIIVLLNLISNFSLWIDEAYTAYFSSLRNLNDLFKELNNWKGSEAQMPGFIILIWIWEKFFGHTEFVLRAFNLVFVIPLFIAIFYDETTIKNKFLFSFLVLINPFFVYNLNEARYTIPVFAIATILILLINKWDKNKKYKILISALIILGSSINMLFAVFLILLMFYDILGSLNQGNKYKVLIKKWSNIGLYTLVPLLLIGYYYIKTLQNGAGGVKRIPGFSNLLFVIYEFFGFLGLGPSRNELREIKLNFNLSEFALVLLFAIILAFIFAYVIFNIKKIKSTEKINIKVAIIIFLLGLVLFYVLAKFAKFQFWGRHLSFLLPFLLLIIKDILILIKNYSKNIFAIFISAIIIFWLISSYNLRFNYNYQKDDYKGAIEYILNKNSNKLIFYSADPVVGAYYGLAFDSLKIPGTWKKIKKALMFETINATILPIRHKAIIIYANKKDLFDKDLSKINYIKENNFREIYKNKDFIIYE